ncbi:GNAT family N-acetyltransferase [Phytoactinopolyspora endophytica]|uniref:GNAT family N-acetyltransferase n=1 Tax=Phytoactinopolyspora endophytica TaxID=1642495 RepID=UPI00101C6F5E|nr:N-acetyltransferase [Phytoactinopolyspora endophytica]
MSDLVIRSAVAEDVVFLEDMLVEAANWPSHLDRSRADTLSDPAIAHYIDGWPHRTDVGVVADDDDQPVGAAWLRFFTESDPGYGFVREDIPELAVGVVAHRRGQGVGRMLLRALADAARQSGDIEHISLSVEHGNEAGAALYRSEGYRVIESRGHADTMLLDLWEPGDAAARIAGDSH